MKDNELEDLKVLFRTMEIFYDIDIEKETIIGLSYAITFYIEKNAIEDDKVKLALEELGAKSPMSVLNEWYEELEEYKVIF